MKTSTITLTIAVLFLGLSACFAQEPAPKRIVSLAPSVTKSLFLLGAQDRLVGVTIYCPPEAAMIEKIGTVYEPNIEKIVSLAPDLVIAAKDGNLPQSFNALKKLKMKIYLVESADNFNEICENFLALGRLVGEEKRALAVIEQSKNKIEQIRKKTEGLKKPSVFWQVGAQPLITASDKSFVNDFIEFAGGINAFAGFQSRYPQISREEVIKLDPDVIIMVSMGDVTFEEKSKWQSYSSLIAARTGRIYMLDDPLFTNPNPQAVADGAEIVAGLLNKKGARK